MRRLWIAASLTLALAACQNSESNRTSRHLAPIPQSTMALMAQKGTSKSDPILMRSFKKESEIEVWKRGSDGRYALLKTYPMCRWSGQLGPKVREGDRQAPEGFYAVTPAAMNPNSDLYLSFNLGYPNEFDRSLGRTGSHLMVHGSCSSRGCFAMTDEAISEVYALARESFANGQRNFQFQSYPFRMTAENLAKHRYDPNIAFWKNLKEGSDYFEVTKEEPRVFVDNRQYAFGSGDASIAAAVALKRQKDEQEIAALITKGVQPIKLVYDDGGQHQTFRQALGEVSPIEGSSLAVDARLNSRLGDVSRPEALAAGPQEIILDANGKPKPGSVLAYASQSGAAGRPALGAVPSSSGQGTPLPQIQASERQNNAPPLATNAAGAGDKSVIRRMLALFGD